MLVFQKQAELKKHLESLKDSSPKVGFIPTMGALHAGHLSLIEKSLNENDLTVMSIFVNPTQFNNVSDLEKYPRNLDADITKIETISDKVIIYAPTIDDIYEGNTISQHFEFDGLENQMEGQHRPGHFDGVGTIVKKLFEIVKPTNAYFGEKDFQQLQIVKKLTEKNQIPVNIVGCPIFREPNGLAMSSRNERLTKEEREKASFIYQTLLQAKEKFSTQNPENVTSWVAETFKKQPDFKLEYFEIADELTLLPCETKEIDKKYRAFIAVFVNEIRLIDTISLN